MTTRRNTLKSLATWGAAGLLAGCTNQISEMLTFEATPAVISQGADVTVRRGSLMPIAGSEIAVTDRLSPVGEISVRSYAVTHAIIRDIDEDISNSLPVIGEVLTVSTPQVNPGGIGERNPAGDFSLDQLDVGGTLTTDRDPGQNPVHHIEFEGIPSAPELLGAGYRGIVRGMEISRPLTDEQSGFRGEATIELRRDATETIDITVSGNQFEHNGEYVFGLAWTSSPDLWMFANCPGGDCNAGWKPGTQIVHPESCPRQQGQDGDCGIYLDGAVRTGRRAFLTGSIEQVQAITEKVARLVEETQALLQQASERSSQMSEETVTAIEQTRRSLRRISTVNGEIRDAVASMTVDDTGKGPASETIQESAKAILEAVRRVETRIGGVDFEVGADGAASRRIAENLGEIGRLAAVVDFSCSMYGSS